MVPFASGTQNRSIWTRSHRPRHVANGLIYVGVYNAYATKPESNKYVAAKYRLRQPQRRSRNRGPAEKSDTPITAKVTYRFPFNIPGIARILCDKGPDGYFFNISSTATIPNEGPRDNRKTIGIGYGTLE